MSGNHATLLFDHSIRCKDLFAKLLNILQDDRSDIDSQPLSVNIVEDELGRFRVWAGNIGALQRGPGSLDYRLREARSARAGFSQLLENLAETLEERESCIVLAIDISSPLTQRNSSPIVSRES